MLGLLIRNPRKAAHRTHRLTRFPLDPIFMLGGAPWGA